MYVYKLTYGSCHYEEHEDSVCVLHEREFSHEEFRNLVALVAPAAWCVLVADVAKGMHSKHCTMTYYYLQPYIAIELVRTQGFTPCEPTVEFSPSAYIVDSPDYFNMERLENNPWLEIDNAFLDGRAIANALVAAGCFENPVKA